MERVFSVLKASEILTNLLKNITRHDTLRTLPVLLTRGLLPSAPSAQFGLVTWYQLHLSTRSTAPRLSRAAVRLSLHVTQKQLTARGSAGKKQEVHARLTHVSVTDSGILC